MSRAVSAASQDLRAPRGKSSKARALPTLVSFEVQLSNRYRGRKKRFLVLDTEKRTLSRSNKDNQDLPELPSTRLGSGKPKAGSHHLGPGGVSSLSSSSRSSRSSSRGNSRGRGGGLAEKTAFDLRKTIAVTEAMMLQPSQLNKRKLRLIVSQNSRPMDIVFETAAAREQFSSIVRTLRAMAAHENIANAEAGIDRVSSDSSALAGSKFSMGSLASTRSRGASDDSTLTLGPARLNIFCCTFNTSSKSAPRVRRIGPTGDEELDPVTNSVDGRYSNRDKEKDDSKNTLHLQDLYEWVPPDEHDLYFIGLQECKAKHYVDWQQLFLSLINLKFETGPTTSSSASSTQGGNEKPKYSVLSSVSMWGIHGLLIVRDRLAHLFSHVHTDRTACGLAGVMGNKGAVGISVEYGDGTSASTTSFAFVNSHLAARAERLPERSQNYAKICHSLLRVKKGGMAGVQLLHVVDHVFWAGDLNYRNDMGEHGSPKEFEQVSELVASGDLRELAAHDQLSHERAMHNVFVGFREGQLDFAPTYRMEFGQQGLYNNKRNQNPSWTDRVLWRSMPGNAAHVELTQYYCAERMVYSDHRPVCAVFDVLTCCALDQDEVDTTLKEAAEVALRVTAHARALKSIKKSKDSRNFREVLHEHHDEYSSSGAACRFFITKAELYCKVLDDTQEKALEAIEEDLFVKNELSTSTVDQYDDDDTLLRSDDEDDNGASSLDNAAAASKRKTLEQNRAAFQSRRNSYSRPFIVRQTSTDDQESSADLAPARQQKSRPGTQKLFVGRGFSCGQGALDKAGQNFVTKASSEFGRYVLHANSGLRVTEASSAKLQLRFQAPFLEDSPVSQSAAAENQESQLFNSYVWGKSSLPSIRAVISNATGYLNDRQVIVTVHKTPNGHTSNARTDKATGPIIGQAHIPLADIACSKKAWFAVPILFNGQPAGVLRGELENPDFTRNSISSSKRLSSLEAFAEDDEDVDSGGEGDSSNRRSYSVYQDVDDEDDSENDEDEKGHADYIEEGEEEGEEHEDSEAKEKKTKRQGIVEREDGEEEEKDILHEPGSPIGMTMSTTNSYKAKAGTQDIVTPPSSPSRPASVKKSGRFSPIKKATWLRFSRGSKAVRENGPYSDSTNSGSTTYSYNKLMKRKFGKEVDQTRLETYLSEDEFVGVFKMPREKFDALPKWKRVMLKKSAKLF